MKRPAIVLAMAWLAGCQGAATAAAEQAERRAAIVRGGGDGDELCAALREVQAAWLKAEDSKRYRDSKLTADIQCAKVDIDRRLGF